MNYRKKPLEEIPEENTAIWACTSDGCNGWMRDNFAFEHAPSCRLCDSPMERSMKMLPILLNSNGDLKSLKKGISIT
ncbi:cold-shock protein [Paenibacillus sp. BR2-3]|uniref:cold-shock protein n=1 Tax=Paenibacillus sp. BR2-3 TaxID=3048494 RepID=UPI0039775D73